MFDSEQLPKVSIIITYYNQKEYISQSLQSALMQDYPNLEIVISDDYSETHFFPKQLITDRGIKYFNNEVNLGRAHNYRKALYDYSTGDFALILNADDYLINPKYISQAIEIFRKYENVAFVFSNVKTYIEKTEKYIVDHCNDFLNVINDGNRFFINFPGGISIPHLTCVFDRSKAMEIGSYQYDILGEDWETFLRLAQNHQVGFIKQISGVYRKHSTNTTKDVNLNRIQDGLKMIESPYHFAVTNQIASEKELLHWKKEMLHRYFFKHLLKIKYLKPELTREFIRLFQRKYPKLFKTVKNDPRYWLFTLFGKNYHVMKLIFKYVIKQPSFIEDLVDGQNSSIS